MQNFVRRILKAPPQPLSILRVLSSKQCLQSHNDHLQFTSKLKKKTLFFCILQSARMNWCKKWSVGVTSSPHHLGWPDEGFHWGFPPDCVILFPKWPHSVQQHTSICTPQDAGTCTNTCTCIVAILYFVLAHYLHYFTKDTFLSFGFRGKSACFFFPTIDPF